MHNLKKTINSKGFTLIELLIVIAIIAILATVVFVALNPVARFQDSRNSRRWSDVNAILSAIKLSQVDKKDYIDAIKNMGTDSRYYMIGIAGNDPGCQATCAAGSVVLEATCVDLAALTDSGYLPSVPIDPNASGAVANYTHYYISKSATGVITVGACDPEIGTNSNVPAIFVSR